MPRAEPVSVDVLDSEATSTPPWCEHAPRPAGEVVPSRQLTLSASLDEAVEVSARVSLLLELRSEAVPTPP